MWTALREKSLKGAVVFSMLISEWELYFRARQLKMEHNVVFRRISEYSPSGCVIIDTFCCIRRIYCKDLFMDVISFLEPIPVQLWIPTICSKRWNHNELLWSIYKCNGTGIVCIKKYWFMKTSECENVFRNPHHFPKSDANNKDQFHRFAAKRGNIITYFVEST